MIHAYACGSPIRKPYVEAAATSVNAKFHPEANPGYRGGDAIVWGKIRGAPELNARVWGANCNVYEMDNGYRGRNRYFRITKNLDQYVALDDRPPDRWEAITKKFGGEIRPWTTGHHILIALSTEWAFKFHGQSLQKWLSGVVQEIRRHTKRPILVRPKDAKGGIEDQLLNCHALITYMSMAGLDALQMGVPVFCDKKCAVSPMALPIEELSSIESPKYPDDRERLFWSLAYQQWTKDELKNGIWKEYAGWSEYG